MSDPLTMTVDEAAARLGVDIRELRRDLAFRGEARIGDQVVVWFRHLGIPKVFAPDHAGTSPL